MTDQRSNLSGKVGLDVTDFKTAIAEMNRSIRVIESGFRATAAGLGDWSKSATGLETRIKALNSQMDLQRRKVEALKSEYQRVAKEKGETSRAAQELEIRLNKETETLGKMESELNQSKTALSDMSKEAKEAGKGTEEAAKGAEELASSEDEAVTSTGRLRDALGRLKDNLKGVAADFKHLGDKVLAGVRLAILGVVGALAGIAAGFAAVVAKTVPAASDLNETINKVGVVFGNVGDEIVKFSETAATALGLSQQQALDAASTFGIFGKAAELTGGDLSDFSLTLARLVPDLASFHNAAPDDVITALGAALRGESEPIRRFGVLLDDATLRAKALELGLVTTTKQALTPQQRVLAAYNVILEQTADAQGDFARTSKGFANAQRIIKALWEDLKVVIGSIFLPIVEKAAGFISSKVLPVLSDFAKYIRLVVQDGDFLNDFLGKLPDFLQPVALTIGRLIEGLQNLWGAILDAGPVSIEAREALSKIFGDKIAGQIQGVLSIIQGLYEAVRLLFTGDFRGGLFGLKEDDPVVGLFLRIRDTILELERIILTFIRDHWEELKGALIGIVGALAAAGVVSAIAGIAGAIGTIVAAINPIVAAAAILGAAWAGNWFGIRDKTKEVIDLLVPKIQELIDKGRELLSKIDWERLKEIAAGAFQAIADAVGSIDWARIGGAIEDAFATISDVFAGIDWEQVGAAISGAFQSIADAVSGIDWAAIRDAMQGAFGNIDWAAIGEAIAGAFETIKGAIGGIDLAAIAAGITGAFQTVKDWFETNWPAIEGIVAGVWTAISGAIGAAVDVIVGQTWPQLVSAFEEIKKTLQESGIDWEILGDILSGVGKFISVVVAGIGASIAVLLGVVVGVVNGIAGALNAMAGHFAALQARGRAIWDALKQVIQGFADFFNGLIAGDFDKAVKGLGKLFGGLVDLVTNMVGAIVEVFTGNLDAITAFVEGFVKGIIGFFQGLYDSLVGNSIIPDLVRDIAKTFLDFDWQKMASDVIEGIKDGIHAGIDLLIGEFEWLVDILSKLKLPDWLTPGSPTPLENALRGISDALDEVNRKGLKDFASGLGKLKLEPLTVQPGAFAGAAGGGGGTNNFYRYDVTQVFPDAGAAAIGMSVFEAQRGNRLDGSMGVGG